MDKNKYTESLGGVDSFIELPEAMTHTSATNSLPAIYLDLARLSAGIENASVQIANIRQAIWASE